MQDLSQISGLPLKLDGWRIFPGAKLLLSEPAVRRIEDIREVLLDRNAVVKPPDLYFMYRDTCLAGDESLLDEHAIRYDVTVIRPGLLGREYIKTAGHYHPQVPGSTTAYPEVYEVLLGTARYLMQKPADTGDGSSKVEDCILVEANPGDKVVMLPGYGHITINPGPGPLVMTNLVSRRFSSIYEPMVRTHGGAYYLVSAPSGYHLVANGNYASLSEPRFLQPAEAPELGLTRDTPLCRAFITNPERFEWLNDPAKYEGLLQKALVR